jgi:arsenite-transporting ATPase
MVLLEEITPGPRWTFVGGKGGVGKTTVAAALAVSLADAGERVLVLSVDPAHSLGDALGVELGAEAAPVPEAPGVEALEVDPAREQERFLAEHREALARVVERGTYLERPDVGALLDLAIPGMDELSAMLRLISLADEAPRRRVVVDTAPTGHTLRLLDLPRLASGWISALEAMEAKHRQVAAALAGAYREDEAARHLASLRARVERLDTLLRDPAHTRFLLVTTPEPVVRGETARYLEALRERGIPLGGVVVNRAVEGAEPPAPGVPAAYVPPLPGEPRGPEGLRRFARAVAASPAPPPPGGGEGGAEIHIGEPYPLPAGRRLYLVGGKGGVGKSTAASALAVSLAHGGAGPVLLLSTDPAGSLGDLFGFPVPGRTVSAPDAPGLSLRQVDAEAAWEAFRAEYREEVERLFAEILGEGISAEADREVVTRLVDLAPPGVDEVMALAEVIDSLEGGEYNALVLDTAPTGHLLRLLEMPAVALDWAHTVLRLLLKYRQVVRLGEAAERVLALARTLRGLRERLADRAHTLFLAVALPEALSVPETRRLLPRLAGLGLAPEALLVNRLLGPGGVLPARRAEAARLLQIPGAPEAVGAPEWEEGPRGAEALLRFAGSWRRIHPG